MKNISEILTESEIRLEDLPDVGVLGDGTYVGMLRAHVFTYNGKDYRTRVGIRCMTPEPWTIIVKDGKEYEPWDDEENMKKVNIDSTKINHVRI